VCCCWPSSDPGLLATFHFQAGAALTAVLLAAGLLVPWERLLRPYYLVIPLLDFLAVGLLQAGGSVEILHLELLTAFPVVWLAASTLLPG
jgi:two-component system, OmpR family, phosphate regulon sensor histidine kinase PhoR